MCSVKMTEYKKIKGVLTNSKCSHKPDEERQTMHFHDKSNFTDYKTERNIFFKISS